MPWPSPDISIAWYKQGLDAVFNKPTLIGVGEAGAERVTVTPLGGGGGGKGDTYSITYNDFRPVVGDVAVVNVLDRLAWKLQMGAS